MGLCQACLRMVYDRNETSGSRTINNEPPEIWPNNTTWLKSTENSEENMLVL